MNAITIHKDHFDVLLDYDNAEIGLLVRALIADSIDQLPKDLKIIYRYIDAQNKRFAEQQEAYAEMQSEKGKKGGAPIGNQNARKQPETTQTTQNKLNKLNKPTVTNTVTVSVSETVTNTETNTETETKVKVKDTPPAPSRGRGERIADFAAFWEAYPRKKSKGQAEKAWNALRPNSELLAIMLDKLAIAKTCRDWTSENGRYIPYPATWLRSKGWEDDFGNASREQSFEEIVREATGV